MFEFSSIYGGIILKKLMILKKLIQIVYDSSKYFSINCFTFLYVSLM